MSDPHRNGNGEAAEEIPIVVDSPRPRRIPTLVELYEMLLKLYDGQLELNERVGHMMRSTAATQADVREIRAELTELRSEERDVRRRLDSVPEMVRDAAEETGRHHVVELERRLAEQQRDSARHALEKRSDRAWQVATIALGALFAIVSSVLVWMLTHEAPR